MRKNLTREKWEIEGVVRDRRERSHTPPAWELWGGLHCHLLPSDRRYLGTALMSDDVSTPPSSLTAPKKLEPQSERNCVTGPRMARNLRRALIKLELSINSITSIWIARVPMHVKRTAQRLAWARPPLVRLAQSFHGPKTSSPTKLNGGAGARRSCGSCAICCVWREPHAFLHLMHFWMVLFTSLFPPLRVWILFLDVAIFHGNARLWW